MPLRCLDVAPDACPHCGQSARGATGRTCRSVITVSDTGGSSQEDPANNKDSNGGNAAAGDGDEVWVDPDFFEGGLEGATAGKVWDGALALCRVIQALKNECSCDTAREAKRHSQWLFESAGAAPLRDVRVVELGAGTGLTGLCAAASWGASVLITDLPSVVSTVIQPNIVRNAVVDQVKKASGGDHVWPEGAVRVGSGQAAAQALDWTDTVQQQVLENVHLVLAADTVWLQTLVDPFASTVAALCNGCYKPPCIFAFKERATSESRTFARSEQVISALTERGLSVERALRCETSDDVMLFRVRATYT